jgi:hypothetical protein
MIEAKELFKAESRTTTELLFEQGQCYYIPAYQRHYTWSEVDVENLTQSVIHALNGLANDDDSFAFLGTTIIIKDENHETIAPLHQLELPAKVFLIIDGQQRFTTIILLLINLHSQLRTQYDLLKKIPAALKQPSDIFLEQETGEILEHISNLLIEFKFRHAKSPAPYIRVIRAYFDAWSKNDDERLYESPLARLIHEYAIEGESFDLSQKKKKFTPTKFEDAQLNTVAERFNHISGLIEQSLTPRGIGEENLTVPQASIISLKNYRSTFFGHIDDELARSLVNYSSDDHQSKTVRLLMFAKFVCFRIALTVVEVKKEEYAFAVFDSLNTTGQPLAPIETFKPLVMKAVGLSAYKTSKESDILDRILAGLGNLDNDSNRKIARQVTVNFALAECGHKLSNDISVQRNFFRNSFKHVSDNTKQAERLEYLNLLLAIVSLRNGIWSNWREPKLPNDHLYTISPEARICLGLIAQLDHTVVLPILARFWRLVELSNAGSPEQKAALTDFEKVAKAIGAFTTLYRAISGTTDGIDNVYREIIIGKNSPSSLGAFHRSAIDFYGSPVHDLHDLNADEFCNDLFKRLTYTGHREISSKQNFIMKCKNFPIYSKSVALSRFMLFVANHDCIGDTSNPGILLSGNNGCNKVLTEACWSAKDATTVEHVAPQTHETGWDIKIYDPVNLNLIHTIGNLTLCPREINSTLSNESWARKRQAYKALGLKISVEEIKDELKKANPSFDKLIEKLDTAELNHCPFFSNIGSKTDDWDADFINARSENILGLVWDRLAPWLEIP